MAPSANPTAAPKIWNDGTPPKHNPWGEPHGWRMIIPGVWQVHTASHGGWWLTEERVAAVPADLAAQNWNGSGCWFEEDSDWALVVRSFPDEFDDTMREHAERDRLWREKNDRLEAAKTPNDIKSALTVKPDDFKVEYEELAIAKHKLGSLTIVCDASNRLAIVQGYTEAQRQLADKRAPTIADCVVTGFQPEDLHASSYVFRVYQPLTNTKR